MKLKEKDLKQFQQLLDTAVNKINVFELKAYINENTDYKMSNEYMIEVYLKDNVWVKLTYWLDSWHIKNMLAAESYSDLTESMKENFIKDINKELSYGNCGGAF